MRTICIDSHPCIWGIKEEATEGQEFGIPRAKSFFKLLKDEGARVLLPSVVLFELLMPIAADDHLQFLSRFQSGFLIVPFDVSSASYAARVWHSKKDANLIDQIKNDLGAFQTS